MVSLGLLGSIIIGILAQIYLSTGYESGTLSMFQAMTFYESFGLEVAYKIIKRKLGCRVYIFSNLSQVWHDQETIQYYDQIFMLVIGRTTKMYNLFEKLEEVNFQTGFELIAEEIIDGNVPYLNWASNFVPPYDAANETTVAENKFLPDTNEAFTFRENFINKKYGTLPPNHTIFAGLDLESNSNNSLQRILHLDIKPYQDLVDRIRKGERFPPDATFPGLEMEQDDELRAISELQEEPIRENLQLIKEQEARAAGRNFGMRQRGYYGPNTPEMVQQDIMPGYYDRNLANIPRYYKQNQVGLPEQDMARYYEQKAQKLYGGNMPIYYEQNQQIIPNYQPNYVPYDPQNVQILYGGNAQMYGQRNPLLISGHDYPLYVKHDVQPIYVERNLVRNGQRMNAEQNLVRYEQPMNEEQNLVRNEPQMNAERNVVKNGQRMKVEQNSVKNGQRSGRPKMEKTSKRRSFMDVIKSFIYSDSESKVTNVNKARVARNGKGPKVRERMQARRVTEVYQPYEVMQEVDEMDDPVDLGEQNAIKHYIYVQHVNHPNVDNGQGFKNERKSVKTRKSRARKNDRQAPRARQTIRAKARYAKGMENSYAQPKMNQYENSQRNMKYYKSQAANMYHRNEPSINHAQHDPVGFHKVDQGINNYHAPGAIHPQAENNVAYFHQINQQNPPQHIHQNRQFDKAIHANHIHETINSQRVHAQQFAEPGHNIRAENMHENVAIHGNQQHNLHEAQHMIRPQHEQNYVGRFHPHNEVIQQLPVVHANHQNLNGHGVRSPYNPNNLPVVHQVANRQPFSFIHNDPVMNVRGIPNVGLGMKNSRMQNAVKSRQSGKVKNIPRGRQSRAGKQKAVWARKSKLITSMPQYNVDIEGNTPVHFIDVLQYHYEPRQKAAMV